MSFHCPVIVTFQFIPTLALKAWFTIDPYQSAAMLSLGRIKSFVFARQASARPEFSARFAVQKQAFYSPETQHGRHVIKDYWTVSTGPSFVTDSWLLRVAIGLFQVSLDLIVKERLCA